MERDVVHEKLEEIAEKLDRMLDPESGIYARLAKHESSDAVMHRTFALAIIVASAIAARAPEIVHFLFAAN